MITDPSSKYQMDLRVDELVDSLVSRIAPNGNTMVWVGSGLSIGCGYPGWPEAIAQLCDACIPGKADISPSTVATDLLVWAQRCKDADPNKYFETLEQMFGTHPTAIRPAYSSICGCPFNFLVTTNFDPCLSTAIGRHHNIISYPELNLFPLTGMNTVIYLHGRVRNNRTVSAKNLLFTSKDLDAAYDHSFLSSALDQLLGGFPTIFVGCGLDEIVLKNLFKKLRHIHEHTGVGSKRKTVLLADEVDASKRDAQNRDMEELGIEVLRFPIDNEVKGLKRYHYLDDAWARVRDELRQNMQPIT
jgi:hypothetical protein